MTMTIETTINHLVNAERRDPGTIWKAGEKFAAEFGGRWELQQAQNYMSTAYTFYAGDKEVKLTCVGNQAKYLITPSFLGNLLRYLMEAKQ